MASKCSQETTSCSRCTRLGITCVGSGQQRYQFKGERCFRTSSTRAREASGNVGEEIAPVAILHTPTSELAVLTGSFIDTIKTSTGLRYNLAWAYGGFLDDIPKRLGVNAALDTAVDALIEGHSSLCTRREPGIKAFMKYCHALKKLRVNLDNPVTARASETLGAVRLLMICQVSLWSYMKQEQTLIDT